MRKLTDREVVMIAGLLDDHMNLYISKSAGVRMQIWSKSGPAMRLLGVITGNRIFRRDEGFSSVSIAKETTILSLLEQCVPYMETQKPLAETALEYLLADTIPKAEHCLLRLAIEMSTKDK